MPLISLPDGSQRRFDNPVTVAEIAASIGPGLGKAALAGRVDGRLVDNSFLVERAASVTIVTERDRDGLEAIRHSTAHLQAYTVKKQLPDAQVRIVTGSENGLYY